MANLVAIGFTVAAGATVFTISMVSFGLAVKNQSTFIAARCTARPKNVIYNPKPSVKCQDRGNPMWGWIPWVMKLSYATMLSGVPGTGTRDGGLSGLMLKVNLDGIVLMRFHHLCLRVCSLAAFLYLIVALPIYKTAQCSRIGGDYNSPTCIEQNITDYQRLTLANIPPLQANNTEHETFGEVILGFFEPVYGGTLARLYAIVFITWVIHVYALTELDDEWRDVLALRRVYFLEADHWSDRNAELAETLLRDEQDKDEGVDPEALTTVSGLNDDESHLKNRDPWVAHPETRDTVPNIELYSVLVGGLPSLPTEAFVQEEVEAVFSRKQAIDWQLAVTAAFFDHCVPNQPGFSSSVAAVTILPSATSITEAWNHWYKAAAKIRRLRFIRRQIAKLRKRESEDDKNHDDGMGDYETKVRFAEPENPNSDGKPKNRRLRVRRKKKKKKKFTAYTQSEEKKKYYSEIFGTTDDVDVEDNILHALNLGPEQTAVYSREFAQGAANLAPYGFNEQKIRRASLPQLLEMEKRAAYSVEAANLALRKAQEKIADSSSQGDRLSDDDLENMMCTVSVHSSNDDLMDSPNPKGNLHRSTSLSSYKSSSSGESFGGEDELGYTYGKLNDTDTETKKLSNVDSAEPKRASFIQSFTSNVDFVEKIVDKSISTMHQSVRNLGSLAQNVVPERRRSTGRRLSNDGGESRKVRRASVSSTQLPDDLGLEANLFLKQRKNSMTDMHRSKSSEDLEEMRKKALKSMDRDRKAPPQRSCSSDAVEIMRAQLENALLDDSESNLETGSTSQESIWDRLARENLRRSALRNRISNMSQGSDGLSSSQKYDTDKLTLSPSSTSKDSESGQFDTHPKPIGKEKHVNFRTDSTDDHGDVENQKSKTHRRNGSSGSAKMFAIKEMNDSDKSFEVEDNFATGNDLIHPLDISKSEISSNAADENLRLAFDFEEKAGLRQRQSQAMKRLSKSTNEKWMKVVQIVKETSRRPQHEDGKDPIASGKWTMPTLRTVYHSFLFSLGHIFKPITWGLQTTDLVDHLASESHYAVVTFTSRQAAAAARHVLADSRGADRWDVISDMPSPPLADAPVCNTSGFRGCVRPVTISINEKQKMIRHYFALALLALIYFFYTIPLTNAQQLLSPETLGRVITDLDVWLRNSFLKYVFTGLIPALVWTAFFAICPPMFKSIANFGSNATSSPDAEGSALKYFWWFMVVSAFTGTSLSSAIIEGFNSGLNLGSEVQDVIVTSAATIPTEVSATWLNWMIVRVSMVLPTQYLLQMNTFLFTWLGLKCCARAVRGGGTGGPVPYRIYVDSGVVMLCLFALAPASPLIAIAAFMYFLFCVPMLRWTMIFLYKPRFDLGGKRFPFCFDMIISGMLVGNILLIAMMVLRSAYGPAFAAFLPTIPTIAYRWILRRRYMKAFDDVALLQTSLLDGWDTTEETSLSKREEFRQFLVDCHKAAYVPVCIASGEGTLITSQPAVTVPLETDVDEDSDDDDDATSVHAHSVYSHAVSHAGGGSVYGAGSVTGKTNPLYHSYQPEQQPGRIMRRASYTIPPPRSVAQHNHTGTPTKKKDYPHSPKISPRQKYLYASPTQQKRRIHRPPVAPQLPNLDT